MSSYLSCIFVTLTLIPAVSSLTAGQSPQKHIESGVVEFVEPVRLMGVTLRGRYLFVHHAGMMQRARPCTYVYALSDANPGRFILSFHCMAVPANPVARATVRLSGLSMGSLPRDVLEVQFPGDIRSHRVPSP